MGDFTLAIREDLECTICLEFAVSPIQSCFNGHIVCGICFDKVKKCGLCQEFLTPDGLAERLVRRYEVDVPCKNVDSGCLIFSKSFKLKAHLSKCQYREISCFENAVFDCQGQLCPLNELQRHLKDVHKCIDLIPTGCDGNTVVITARRNTFNANYSVSRVFHMEYDDKVFLIHRAWDLTTSAHYLWLTVIGGPDDAEGYKYVVKVKSPVETPESKKIEFRWTLPVLPLRENFDFKNILKSGLFASINPTALLPICTEGEHNGKLFKYCWSTEIKVMKL